MWICIKQANNKKIKMHNQQCRQKSCLLTSRLAAAHAKQLAALKGVSQIEITYGLGTTLANNVSVSKEKGSIRQVTYPTEKRKW